MSMSYSVLCTTCGKWFHARCTDRKKDAVYLNKNFVCKKCRSVVKNFKRPNEKLCDGVETVSKFTYLGDRLNATGVCKTAVTARSKIGWNFMTKQKSLTLFGPGKIFWLMAHGGDWFDTTNSNVNNSRITKDKNPFLLHEKLNFLTKSPNLLSLYLQPWSSINLNISQGLSEAIGSLFICIMLISVWLP